MKESAIQTRVTPEVKEKFRLLAEKQDMSESQLLRKLILKTIKESQQ